MEERYLTRKEASRLSGFSESALARWAMFGKGPRMIKYGTAKSARVRYPLSKLIEFMQGGGEEKGG